MLLDAVEQQGLDRGHRWMAAATCDALWEWSGHGARPVVIDAASCTNGLLDDARNHLDDEHRDRLDQITLIDAGPRGAAPAHAAPEPNHRPHGPAEQTPPTHQAVSRPGSGARAHPPHGSPRRGPAGSRPPAACWTVSPVAPDWPPLTPLRATGIPQRYAKARAWLRLRAGAAAWTPFAAGGWPPPRPPSLTPRPTHTRGPGPNLFAHRACGPRGETPACSPGDSGRGSAPITGPKFGL